MALAESAGMPRTAPIFFQGTNPSGKGGINVPSWIEVPALASRAGFETKNQANAWTLAAIEDCATARNSMPCRLIVGEMPK